MCNLIQVPEEEFYETHWKSVSTDASNVTDLALKKCEYRDETWTW